MMRAMTTNVLDDSQSDGVGAETGTPPTPVEEPAEVPEPEIEAAPGAVAGNLSPKAVASVVIITILGFAATIIAGWSYIVTAAEAAEGEDWTQISALIDKVDNLVLFLLGAIFGVAVQQRQTSAARNVAKNNADEAKRQHEKARTNRDRAAKNKKAAQEQNSRANVGVRNVRKTGQTIRAVERDASVAFARLDDVQWAEPAERGILRVTSLGTHAIVPRQALLSTAPQLSDLADRLDQVADELETGRL